MLWLDIHRVCGGGSHGELGECTDLVNVFKSPLCGSPEEVLGPVPLIALFRMAFPMAFTHPSFLYLHSGRNTVPPPHFLKSLEE